MKVFATRSQRNAIRILQLATLAASAMLLTACQSGVQKPPKWSVVAAVGTIVKLNRPLPVASGRARVFIQNGRVIAGQSGVVGYEPWCQFYVERSRTELQQPFTIQPDSFEITSVYRRQETVLNSLDSKQPPAQGVIVAGPLITDDEGRPDRTLATYYDLASDAQPNVTRLSCARWSDSPPFDYVGLEDMAKTLNGIVELL